MRSVFSRPYFLGIVIMALVACGNDDKLTAPIQEESWLPAATAPESLISALQVIYNDTQHSPNERLVAYAGLLALDFKVLIAEDRSWGRDQELKLHQCLFEAQGEDLFLVGLRVEHLRAEDLDPPRPDRAGWKQVFATNVHLRILTTPQDGLELNGGQAVFLSAPIGDRWFLKEWVDLPRPEPRIPLASEPQSWWALKQKFCDL